LRTPRRQDMADDHVDAFTVFALGKDERTAAGLDGSDALRLESVDPNQQFRVFICEDVVCDDARIVLFPQSTAQGQNQRVFPVPTGPPIPTVKAHRE